MSKKGIRFSYSKLTCFKHCKYEYYLQYILKDEDDYPAEGNYYAEVGSFVHEILAMIFEGKLKQEDALNYFIDNYDDNVSYKVKQSTMDKTFVLLAEYFEEIDLDWLKDYSILGVELEVNFKLAKKNFIGFIDLLLRDKRDGKIVVLDHKSSDYPFKKNGEVKKASEQNLATYKRQMYLYCYAVNQIYGEMPKEIIWNHFKAGGKLARIPFDQNEYDETIDWIKGVIKEISEEEEFDASSDYFYCNNLCPFRNSCEYLKFGGGE